MASATTRPTFSFHHRHHFPQLKPPSLKPHHFHLPLLPLPLSSPRLVSTTTTTTITISSVDVSKEETPLSPSENTDTTTTTTTTTTPPGDAENAGVKSEPKLDPRRVEEKFAVLNTGIYECRSCGYRYDEAAGDPSYPVPPGFEFAKLPDDWRCPTCGAARSFFESKSVEVAGFAQNQQFGLGANSLTSGQKALLIYGGLLLGFVFFLSGYFLQ
ncbi:uncharacterized protein LOC109709539 [Ananas comosus]|uniref:Rubredoxin n=1 Tax=Ananas comosus TaxID=4615 RepID=A0A199VYG5_ANACO|nr:uncharacterized protein LOC109709539 [Ananas comosus]OAY82016.1 Rubredoxin [Ananas comosus]